MIACAGREQKNGTDASHQALAPFIQIDIRHKFFGASVDHKNDKMPISQLAKASLLLGLLSLVLGPFSGVPAIVCGHIARSRIKSNPSLTGSRIAFTGLMLGYIMTILGIAILLSQGKPVTPLFQYLH